jgi:uncharacterized membrane protein YphA (DoxX/SURF4 family)
MMKKNLLRWCCNKDFGLFLMRVVIALVFIGHGMAKFQSIDQTIIFFSTLGLGVFWVYVVATVEVFGGLLMLLGIFTQYAGILLAIIMVFSTTLVKLKMGYSYAELDIAMFALVMGITTIGPGNWSVSKKMCGCGMCNLCGCNKCNHPDCDGCTNCKDGLCTKHEKMV